MRKQSTKDLYYIFVTYATKPFKWFYRLKYRKPLNAEGHYVQVGCGDDYKAGMLNIDANAFTKKDLWLDVRNGLPFKNDSVFFLYCSHMLEHVFPWEAISLLKEIHRVLKDDGVARIAVPSFEHAMRIADGTAAERPWPRTFQDAESQAVNYLFCDGQHKYGYTNGILRDFAAQAGFAVVRRVDKDGVAETKCYGNVEIGEEPLGSCIVELCKTEVSESAGNSQFALGDASVTQASVP